jgi:two-component system, NtrC family, sensor kinase
MRSFRLNLTFAILSSLACLLILTWLLLSIISFKTAEQNLIAQKSDQARAVLVTLLSTVPLPLVTTDLPVSQLPRAVGALAQERDFAGFLLVDEKGSPAFAYGDSRGRDDRLDETIRVARSSVVIADNGLTVLCYAPLLHEGGASGAARLTLSLATEHGRLSRSRQVFLSYFLLDFVLLLVLGAFLLRRIVVLPVRTLLTATERITAGDYSHPITQRGSAELASLAASFNMMQETLKSRQEEVERHVASLEEANQALQRAREETIRSEKMASVGLLAAGMAHEVGTPLAAIIGYAGILADEVSGNADQADYVLRIGKEAARIDRLVRELLDYARPRPAENEPVHVTQVLAEVMEMLQRQGVFKQLETTLQCAEDLPTLTLDRHQLTQVFINLLLNGRDAMPNGGTLAVRVTAGTFQPNGQGRGDQVRGRRRADFGGAFRRPFAGESPIPAVVVEVSDTGEGIAPENLGKVFDPFFTTKEPGRGTGLGLAICARIIDSFGGRITVSSRSGTGTVFTIWLPQVTGAGQEERRNS